MSTFERKVKRSAGAITIALEPNENVLRAKSLHGDLTTAFSQPQTKKIRLDAAKTESIDTSFLQIVSVASLHASQQGKVLELKGFSPELSKRFEIAGIPIPG